jgi:hypothetical protein
MRNIPLQATRFTPALPHFTGGPEEAGKKSKAPTNPELSQFLGQPKSSEQPPVDVIDLTRRSPLAREARFHNALSDLQDLMTSPAQLVKALGKGTLSLASQGKDLLVKVTSTEGAPDTLIHVEDTATIAALMKAEQTAKEETAKKK